MASSFIPMITDFAALLHLKLQTWDYNFLNSYQIYIFSTLSLVFFLKEAISTGVANNRQKP